MTERGKIRKDFDVKQFLNKHQRFKKKVNYTYEELHGLIDEAKLAFHDENALCELSIPVHIVGDIHGQFDDLQRIFAAVGLPGKVRYLFLGDYVDRGPNSLECICSLIAYKLLFPKKVYLLRGNHESEYVNRGYGFWEEIQNRFKLGLAIKIFKMFNELFNYFPLAALIQNKILCMHGGLSPHLKSLDDIRKIRMPVMNIASEGLSQDLLWADPKYDLKGFKFNDLRECSVLFGEDVVFRLCKKLNLDLIVRAHQVMTNGYAFFADRHLVTIFSAPRYMPELYNKGAIMRVSSSMVVSFVILNPAKSDNAGPEAFKNSFTEESTQAYSSME